MTERLGTPELEYYSLESAGNPQALRPAARAVWEDGTYVFIGQSGDRAEWKKVYALWADLQDGFAPYRCQQISGEEFENLVELRGMRAPTAEEWKTLYWAPDGTRMAAASDLGKERSPEPYGR